MKRIIAILLFFTVAGNAASAQSYVKLNGIYALAGVINPSVEIAVSEQFSFNTEVVYSPWKSVNNKPLHFGIFMNEVRWHPKETFKGWYLGPTVGMQGFYMSKDNEKNCKGWGILMGLTAGYQWQVSKRLLLEAFLGYGWQHSWYVGYDQKTGEEKYPYNKSAEWLPYKIGLNIGYKIFDPERKKKK